MRTTKRFYFLVGLLLIGALLLGCEEDTEVTRVDEETEETEETVAVEEPEPLPEPEPEPETEPDEEEGPLAENSRTNPAGLNQVFIVEKDDWFSGKVSYEIELTEIISGEAALDMVKAANRFNDEPGEGKEYILARFRFKILETEEDEPYNVNHAQFDVVSQDGIPYDDFVSVSGLEPNLRRDLYEGAELNGYTYFIVDREDSPVAAYDRGRPGEIWFDLRAK